MLRCNILDVQGFDPAIHGMRNPKNSWDKSDSYDAVNCGKCGLIDEKGVCNKEDRLGRCDKFRCYAVGDNDLKLMKTLFNAGTEHRKYDRMIQVWMDIEAPLYWWKEFDTYKIGTVANSCSTMHKIHGRDLTLNDFSTEHLSKTNLIVVDMVIDAINNARQDFLQNHDKIDWWQMIQLLPSSYNQKRTVMMNYEVIARIIEQRSHHKLDEWHQLVDVLGGLPYMKELIE